MRAARSIAVVLLASVLLTGCFTGERAYFAESSAAAAAAEAEVADPAIQAVIAKLETVNAAESTGQYTGQYTATYDVITKFGNSELLATVAQTSPVDRSITIGHVRFLDQPAGAQTCELTTGACVTGLQDQQISDTQLTHDFYAASPVLRLRQDAATMVSAAVGSTKQIAGQNATCVEVFFAAGSKTYCALDNGLLAQQDTPDLRIDLTGLAQNADTGLFTSTTVAAG